MSSDISAAAYRRTPEGEQELAEPKHGLSISQRRTLQLVDGQSDTASLAARVTGSADEQQLLRDIERLEKLGLLTGGNRVAGMTGATPMPQARRKSRAAPVLMGLALLVAGAGAIFVKMHETPPAQVVATTQQTGAAGEAVVQPEPVPAEDDKVFGVMPNPARWFSPAAKTEEPVAEPARKQETAKPAAPAANNKLATAAASAPVVATPSAAVPTPTPAPKPVEAAPVAVPPPAPVQVAAAAPAPTAKAEPDRRPVYREQPAFPADAARAGVESGSVRARMLVNEAGQVTRVEILESKPRRVFDRAVTAALSKWKFRESATGFAWETLIEFKPD